MTTTRAVTTTTHTDFRIMRQLDGAYDGEWHQWEVLTASTLERAERRLAIYEKDRGVFRLEQRTVVTMHEEWAEVTE